MSIVQYNGNRLIPAPLVNINKTYLKSGDGEVIGANFNVSVEGTLIAFKGSPTSSGAWYTGTGYPSDEVISSDSRLASIQKKQDALRQLFAYEGKPFIIKGLNNAITMSGYPRLVDISFSKDIWYDRSDYVINLEFDHFMHENEDSDSHITAQTQYLSEASESWNIDTDERPENETLSRSYRLTHSISATGKRHYNNSTLQAEAWQQAQEWVQAKLGFDNTIYRSSGVNNLPAYYGGYNHIRTENLDENAGTYSVVETWILTSGTALEDYSVTTTSAIDATEDIVRVEGTITGLENRVINDFYDTDTVSTSGTRYYNANQQFIKSSGLALTRAQAYSGITLNIIPTTSTIGKNPVAGTINYSFTYDTRPSNLIANAKSETISVNDSVVGGNSFAEIFVLGRTYGPILQTLSTRPSFKRTLNIELVVNRPTVSGTLSSIQGAFYNSNPRVSTSTSGDIQTVINAIDPSQYNVSECYSDPPQENWDFLKGRYSYNRTWTYVPSG